MTRKVWAGMAVLALIAAAAGVSVAARTSRPTASVLTPQEALSVPRGSTPDTVAYRKIQADGWVGPSTFAVAGNLTYLVDRVNKEIKVYSQDGKIVSRITLPEAMSHHPEQVEVVGKTIYLTYHVDTASMLAQYRDGEWKAIDLDNLVPGFRGWFHLSSPSPGRLAILRDIPPDEDEGDIPRWAVLDENAALVTTRLPLLSSPDDAHPEPHLVTPNSDHQEIALVSSAGNIVKRVPVENGAPTNVITLMKDRTQDVFMRARPLTGEPDRWTTYLTVFGPNLEVKSRQALSLPEEYSSNFVFAASDVGRTEVVANDRYYDLIYLKDRMVIFEWNALGKR